MPAVKGTPVAVFPPEPSPQTLTVRVMPSSESVTVYYKSSSSVTTSSYDGTLAVGGTLSFSSPKWFICGNNPQGVQGQAELNVEVETDDRSLGTLDDRLDRVEATRVRIGPPTGVAATDTATLQAAVNSFATGGIVEVSAGDWNLSSQITVPDFVTIQGAGMGARASEISEIFPRATVFKHAGTADFDMFANVDGTNGNTGIQFCDFAVNYVNTTADISAFRMSRVWRCNWRNVAILGGTTTNRRGIYFSTNSENMNILGCYLEGCGIYSTGTTNTIRILHSEVGQGSIQIIGGYSHLIAHSMIYHDGFSSDSPVGDCIQLAGVNESIVAYNNVRGAYNGHGIHLPRGSNRCMIVGNHVYENSRKTAGTWSGITLDSDIAASPTEKNTVIGNVCYDRQATKTQQYGILVKSTSGTQTNSNTIRDNILLDNRTAGLNIGTTGLTNLFGPNTTTAVGTVLTVASATTIAPTAGGLYDVFKVSGAVTIDNITADGWEGRYLTLHFQTGGAVVRHFGGSGNIRLAGGANFTTGTEDMLTLRCIGGVWFEQARTVI